MATKHHDLRAPFAPEALAALRAGDHVHLSGPMHTARCRLQKLLLDGLASPVKWEPAALYFCSPIIVRAVTQWSVRAAGPSASSLTDTYLPDFIERYRVRVVVGMGACGEPTRRACARFGCAYLQTVGGAASKLAESIRGVTNVYFIKELGAADALWVLEAEKLEAIVAIDPRGGSLHRRVKAASRRALAALW